MPVHTFDGLDLDDGVTYFTDLEHADPYRAAAVAHEVVPTVLRAGGVLVERPAAPRTVTLGGRIKAATPAAWETARDTLVRTLLRPRRRLTTAQLADRYVMATAVGEIVTQKTGAKVGIWQATFACEDAYESALTPSGDVRTPALALLPGETVQRGVSYALTPGGSAPVAPRWLVTNQAGGVTPLLWEVRNLTNGQALTLAEAVPAGSALLLDPQAGAYAGSLSSLVGFWPLADADGPALDFSGNSRDLTENGTVSFLQDGPERFDVAVGFGSSTANFLSSSNTAFGLTGAFSVACWLWISSAAAIYGVINKADASINGWSLGIVDGAVRLETGDGVTRSFHTIGTVGTGRWELLVWTRSSAGEHRLYQATEDLPPRLTAVIAGAASLTASAVPLRLGGGFFVQEPTIYGPPDRMAGAAIYSASLTADQVRRVWARGPQAYADRQIEWRGRFPELDPREGATNTVRLRADHASTNPAPRIAATWRSRYA